MELLQGFFDKTKGKKLKKYIIIAIVLLVMLALAAKFLLGGVGKSAGSVEYREEAVASRTIFSSLTGSGTLQPANSYTVTTLVEGEILLADFEEGDIIEKDALLYQIDSSDASNNIERAQISLNQAQRSYQNTLDRLYVKAAISGQLYSLNVEVGDEVTQGQIIGTIYQNDNLTLTVPFPADDAETFYAGQPAVVTLNNSFETLDGVIKSVSGSDIIGAGNMVTRNVTITVANPGGLGVEQTASASIDGINCAAPGSFAYPAESTLIAETGGEVTAILVQEGESVSKNQTILTLGGEDVDEILQNASESLRNAELSMSSTQNQLDNYLITSPIQGTVVDKQYKAGDNVESGRNLCTIYDLSYLEMTINIDELDISNVAVGQEVQITADAVENQRYLGVITKVSLLGTTGSGGATYYPVTVRLDEFDGLRPGMNVDAEITLARADDVLAVPNEVISRGNLAMITANSPSAVNAVENDNQTVPDGYVYVRVEIGLSDDNYTQIISGLQLGDTVAYRRNSNSNANNMMMVPGGGLGGAPGGMGGAPGGGGNRGGGGMGGGPR